MKKRIGTLATLILCLLGTTLFIGAEGMPEIPMTELGIDALEAVAPATKEENGTVNVRYEDVPAAGGVKVTIPSDKDGYKVIELSYDHAHKTGTPVPMCLYVNQPDDVTEGGTSFLVNNIADGRWGRYATAKRYIQVKKGNNTVRIASEQANGGWNFYVDKISYSKVTYDRWEDVPRESQYLPKPESIYDRLEAELLYNDDSVTVLETDDEGGGSHLHLFGDGRIEYRQLDFGQKGNVTSLTFRHKNNGTIPHIRVLSDDSAIAEGNLISDTTDYVWRETTLYLSAPLQGVHDITIENLYGTFDLNWLRFGTQKKPAKTVLPYRDVMADTWVATDDLGRSTPVLQEVGMVPHDRSVGIFYFIWHNGKNAPLYDHTLAYETGGVDAVWDTLTQGPLGFQHYWSRPYFGYYRTEDEWIIRKHAAMLANAGVDFIFLDCSNDICYPGNVQKIINTWSDIRANGGDTPQITFLFGNEPDRGKRQTENVYHFFFACGENDDLFFKWQDKPLLLANTDDIKDLQRRGYFTFRQSWAFNSWTNDGKNRWPWIAETPQTPGADRQGLIEQVSVTCGFHASGSSHGRSYHDGKQPTDGLKDFEFELETTPLGLAFSEQWETVYRVEPPLVMVTGWNEWWAGRWTGTNGEKIANTYTTNEKDPVRQHYYVDNFNREFSRDLEPEDGILGDNYYHQLVQQVRRYKGVRDIPTAAGAKDIVLSKDFSQWEGVNPVFYDRLGDVTHRNEPANSGDEVYINTTGRNDIDIARVSLYGDSVSFYVKTASAFTGADTESFMNLWIDADADPQTGWHGYDYRIARYGADGTVSVDKTEGGWNWVRVGSVSYVSGETELAVKLPLSLLDMSADMDHFDFKWSDNSVTTDKVMGFYDLGDAAPDDRFNFRWRKAQDGMSEDRSYRLSSTSAIMLTPGSQTAYLGTKKLDLGDSEPLMQDGKMMVPLRFVGERLGITFDWNEQKHTVFARNRDRVYQINVNNLSVTLNGETVNVHPILHRDRLYVTPEEFSAMFNCKYRTETKTGELYIGRGVAVE